MLRSFALLHRNARLVFIFSVFFAVVWGAAPGDLLADRGAPPGGSAASPSLGTAASFAVLGGPAVTCTTSTVTGDVGAGFAGAPVTQTLCSVVGTVHAGDAAAAQAYNDFLLAYLALGATPCSTDPTHHLTGSLSGVTLTPGVYCFDAPAVLTGVLTLDALGNPNAVWIFKVGSTLAGGALTGTNFSVVMAGGGQGCNVSWWVAEAATLTASSFQGTILAGAGITFTGPGSLVGRALAKAAVTLTGMNPFGGCGAAAAGPPPACEPRDRESGEGNIKLPYGAKGTFEASGENRHGTLSGHLEYTDNGPNGPRVKGTAVTQYMVVDAVTRHIEGTAKIKGLAGFTYQVDMSDNGKGRNDMFAIRLFNASGALVYSASGNLGDGNIHLHKAHGNACDEGDDDEHDDDGGDGDGGK